MSMQNWTKWIVIALAAAATGCSRGSSTLTTSPSYPEGLSQTVSHIVATSRSDRVTSSADLPYAGSFFNSVTGEWVNISQARIHVDTQVSNDPSNPFLDLHANFLADTYFTAIGATTGAPYHAQGSSDLHLVLPSPIRLSIAQVQGRFSIPPNPVTPNPIADRAIQLFLQLTLRFTTDGTLLVGGEGGSSVRLCGETRCSTT